MEGFQTVVGRINPEAPLVTQKNKNSKLLFRVLPAGACCFFIVNIKFPYRGAIIDSITELPISESTSIDAAYTSRIAYMGSRPLVTLLL